MRDSRSRLSLHSIQEGCERYSWRGVPCIKSPFEIVLYARLVWKERPRTVIEIGTNAGGGALFFHDLQKLYGIEGQVVSVDIEQKASHPGITFLHGDANDLGKTLNADFLDSLPRPWLVVEDSSHFPAETLAVLRFFDSHRADYIVVEDGIMSDLGFAHEYRGGPGKAIQEFLGSSSNYVIDSDYCDFYGYNVTWNPNGYLRRKEKSS